MTAVFEIYHLFKKLLTLTIEWFHEILVVEWYYEKAALVFAIKGPKINYQEYHFLEILNAESKIANVL